MNNIRPEDGILRNYVKNFSIVVTVYASEAEDADIIRTELMDYGNLEDRKWLGKLSHFYWTQGCVVETKRVR